MCTFKSKLKKRFHTISSLPIPSYLLLMAVGQDHLFLLIHLQCASVFDCANPSPAFFHLVLSHDLVPRHIFHLDSPTTICTQIMSTKSIIQYNQITMEIDIKYYVTFEKYIIYTLYLHNV